MAISLCQGVMQVTVAASDYLLPCRCREIMRNSPTALRLLKSAMNAVEDGQSGLQQLGGDATMLFYNSEEGNEVIHDSKLALVNTQHGCGLFGIMHVLCLIARAW